MAACVLCGQIEDVREMSGDEQKSHEPVDIETIIDALGSRSHDQIYEIHEKAHPGDVERAFERLADDEREEILNALPAEVLSEWADYLPPADVQRRLASMSKPEQKEVLGGLSDDELVDFLQEVEEEERPKFIELLPDEKRQTSEDLLQYPEESAGGRMTTAMATIGEDLTVREAITELETVKEETELLSRIFVIDKDRHLLGHVRLRDLAFTARDTPVKEIFGPDHFSILALEDQEEAANMIARYDLLALPVVNETNQLLGVITHDDALEILEEESTEDMEKSSGIGGDRGDLAYLQTSVWTHLRRRFVWVLVLAFLALASGVVLLQSEDILKAYYVLALYMPMVVAAGGNTGAQSATMVIRAMSLGELGPSEFWRVVWKEFRIGIFLGGLLGICVAFQIQFLLPAHITEGVSLMKVTYVVGLALTAQVLTSTLTGAALPILARMAKLDPAVVASPAITTLVDVSGSLIYFALARTLI